MAVDPFAHIRQQFPHRRDPTHVSEAQLRSSLPRMQDYELLLLGVFISGQCAALDDLAMAGLSDWRIEDIATALKRQAELLSEEGQRRGFDLYGSAGNSAPVS